MVEEYVSLRAHPMELLRPGLPDSIPHNRLGQMQGRATITRQRPGSASGVIFLTLEDESGTANVIVWKKIYAAFRKAVIAGRLIRVTGRIQRDGSTTHLIAERVEDMLLLLATLSRSADASDSRSRISMNYKVNANHLREQAKKLFPSRDFH